jgi:hypothetical protein
MPQNFYISQHIKLVSQRHTFLGCKDAGQFLIKFFSINFALIFLRVKVVFKVVGNTYDSICHARYVNRKAYKRRCERIHKNVEHQTSQWTGFSTVISLVAGTDCKYSTLNNTMKTPFFKVEMIVYKALIELFRILFCEICKILKPSQSPNAINFINYTNFFFDVLKFFFILLFLICNFSEEIKHLNSMVASN